MEAISTVGEVFCEDCRDAITPATVEFMVPVEKHCVGAKFCSRAQGHRGVHARSVALRSSQKSQPRAGRAGRLRLRASPRKLGSRQQFDGNKKRVHIDVKNGGNGIRGSAGASFCRAENGPASHISLK